MRRVFISTDAMIDTVTFGDRRLQPWPRSAAWPLACLVVAGLALPACSPALNWREVKLAGDSTTVAAFPCKPEHQSRQLTLPGLEGGPVTMHVMSCEADGAQWAVSYLHAGDALRRIKVLGLLSQSLNQNLTMGQAQRPPRDLGPTTVPGATAHPDARSWWQTGMRPTAGGAPTPVQARAWHFSRGLMVYQASVWQTTLSPDDPRLTPFATGFNFRP